MQWVEHDMYSQRSSLSSARILWALAVGVIQIGLAMPATAVETVLVDIGEDWTFFRGEREPTPDPDTGEPTLEWTDLDFDDSDWDVGPTGIGYGDGDDASELLDMRNLYFSVFTRKIFELDDPQSVERLALEIDYDDGFVAYLNGVEIARAGLTGTPPAFGEAAASHEAGSAEVFIVDEGLLESENVPRDPGPHTRRSDRVISR